MKILIVPADGTLPDSALLQQLHTNGHDLLVVSPTALSLGEIPCKTASLNPKELNALVREFAPDVIHGFGAAACAALEAACRRMEVPLLVSLKAGEAVGESHRRSHILVDTLEEKQELVTAQLIPSDLIHVAEPVEQLYQALLHPAKPIKAAISGYYGYGNLGDDAILSAISRQMAMGERPIQLHVLSRRPEQTRRDYGLRAIQRFNPFKVYRTLKACDVLISGGGSLLQDKTSTRSLLYYIALIRLAKFLGKPVFMYANGIGPVSRSSNRRKVRKCVELCDVVTLRDKDSVEELRSLGVSREDLVITGDPVFTLPPPEEAVDPLANLGIEHPNGVIGISVRSIPDMTNFPKEFAGLCDRLIRERGKAIVFLIMQESIDEPISRAVQQLMTEPSYIRKTPGDLPSMLKLIRGMEALIAMRLHTIIFAANVNVPVVGCNYDPKVASMLDILGLPSCGTPADMDADKAFETCTRMLDNLPRQKELLAEKVSGQIDLAAHTAQLFEDMLRKNNII